MPSEGKFTSVSLAGLDFIIVQQTDALSQLPLIFFAEEKKLTEKISATK